MTWLMPRFHFAIFHYMVCTSFDQDKKAARFLPPSFLELFNPQHLPQRSLLLFWEHPCEVTAIKDVLTNIQFLNRTNGFKSFNSLSFTIKGDRSFSVSQWKIFFKKVHAWNQTLHKRTHTSSTTHWIRGREGYAVVLFLLNLHNNPGSRKLLQIPKQFSAIMFLIPLH